MGVRRRRRRPFLAAKGTAAAGRKGFEEAGDDAAAAAAEIAAPDQRHHPEHGGAAVAGRGLHRRQAVGRRDELKSRRRLAATPAAAMPTSPHGPHCTLEAATPWARRQAAMASRHALAEL